MMGLCRGDVVLNSFLDVGDNSTSDDSLFEIACSPGLSPVGFSASSMCFAVSTFQAGPSWELTLLLAECHGV